MELARVVLVREVVVLVAEDHVVEVDQDDLLALVELLRDVLHGELEVVLSDVADLENVHKNLLRRQPHELAILATDGMVAIVVDHTLDLAKIPAVAVCLYPVDGAVLFISSVVFVVDNVIYNTHKHFLCKIVNELEALNDLL